MLLDSGSAKSKNTPEAALIIQNDVEQANA